MTAERIAGKMIARAGKHRTQGLEMGDRRLMMAKVNAIVSLHWAIGNDFEGARDLERRPITASSCPGKCYRRVTGASWDRLVGSVLIRDVAPGFSPAVAALKGGATGN